MSYRNSRAVDVVFLLWAPGGSRILLKSWFLSLGSYELRQFWWAVLLHVFLLRMNLYLWHHGAGSCSVLSDIRVLYVVRLRFLHSQEGYRLCQSSIRPRFSVIIALLRFGSTFQFCVRSQCPNQITGVAIALASCGIIVTLCVVEGARPRPNRSVCRAFLPL